MVSMDKVSVSGLGYIGLPTAALIASRGFQVNGVDVNKNAIETINQGKIHIVEPGLEEMVNRVVVDNKLVATDTPAPADVFIICVPTPFSEGNIPDLSYIEEASQAIAPVLSKGNLVILESTSPVGTTEKLSNWLSLSRQDLTFPHIAGEHSDIRVAHCPERVLPGNIIHELVENDRIIGGVTNACSEAAVKFYKNFVKGSCIVTNAKTAEMCKLVENSFRDVNIAFANELSLICDELRIDVWDLIQLANKHPRVNILQPGCGVGGHCIAVDPYFLISQTPDAAKLISTARNVNNDKPSYVVQQIIENTQRNKCNQVAVLGISFKPDIDDIRESPALDIAHELKILGFEVKIIEPNLDTLPEQLIGENVEKINLSQLNELDDKCTKAVLVAHSDFKAKKDLLQLPHVLDFCGALR